MSDKALKYMQEMGTSAVLSMKHMEQHQLDLIATMSLLMYGFTTHPNYNQLSMKADTKEYMELVKDEFRQINGYIDVDLKSDNLLTFPARYTEEKARDCVVTVGRQIADYTFLHNELPDHTTIKDIYSAAKLKYFNKE